MQRKRLARGPLIPHDSAYASVVENLENVPESGIVLFFNRVASTYLTALFLSDVMFWFMPSLTDPNRPRATIYREGCYWVGLEQKIWRERHAMTRYWLEIAYRRCSDFLIVKTFTFEGYPAAYCRFNFERFRTLMEQDRKLQARLRMIPASRPEAQGESIRDGGALSRNTQQKGNKLPPGPSNGSIKKQGDTP